MTDCKFGIADCTPLRRCEEERAEFDRLLLDVKTESVPVLQCYVLNIPFRWFLRPYVSATISPSPVHIRF